MLVVIALTRQWFYERNFYEHVHDDISNIGEALCTLLDGVICIVIKQLETRDSGTWSLVLCEHGVGWVWLSHTDDAVVST